MGLLLIAKCSQTDQTRRTNEFTPTDTWDTVDGSEIQQTISNKVSRILDAVIFLNYQQYNINTFIPKQHTFWKQYKTISLNSPVAIKQKRAPNSQNNRFGLF